MKPEMIPAWMREVLREYLIPQRTFDQRSKERVRMRDWMGYAVYSRMILAVVKSLRTGKTVVTRRKEKEGEMGMRRGAQHSPVTFIIQRGERGGALTGSGDEGQEEEEMTKVKDKPSATEGDDEPVEAVKKDEKVDDGGAPGDGHPGGIEEQVIPWTHFLGDDGDRRRIKAMVDQGSIPGDMDDIKELDAGGAIHEGSVYLGEAFGCARISEASGPWITQGTTKDALFIMDISEDNEGTWGGPVCKLNLRDVGMDGIGDDSIAGAIALCGSLLGKDKEDGGVVIVVDVVVVGV